MHNLMQGLGQLLQIDLREDFNQSCTLNMDGIKVQMELDSPGEFLLLMTFISELPPGQFRETVLKEALKVNYTVEQKIGTLSIATAFFCFKGQQRSIDPIKTQDDPVVL